MEKDAFVDYVVVVKENTLVADHDSFMDFEDTFITEFSNNIFTSWNETNSQCDRRLSRAASKIMHTLLLQTISFYARKENVHDNEEVILWKQDGQYSLEELLEAAFSSGKRLSTNRLSSCPLFPNQGVLYRADEQNTTYTYISSLPGGLKKNLLKSAYPHHILQYHRPHVSSQNGRDVMNSPHSDMVWYQCGYCGKTFTTQFYVDVHMNRQHGMMTRQPPNDYSRPMLCAAKEWCKLFGYAACHEQALYDEPFYGRGGNPSVNVAASALIRHKWTKIAHSLFCSVSELQNNCRLMMTECGFVLETNEDDKTSSSSSSLLPIQNGNVADYFCQLLTCPRQDKLWHWFGTEEEFQQLYYTSSSRASNLSPSASALLSKWQEVWTREMRHYHSLTFSWLGVAVIIGLCFWMIHMLVMIVLRKNGRSDRLSIPVGKRLLYKRGSQFYNRRDNTPGWSKSTTRIKKD